MISAAKNGHAEAVKLLLDHGVGPGGAGRSRKMPGRMANPLSLTTRIVETNDAAGMTAYEMALERGHTKVVNLLQPLVDAERAEKRKEGDTLLQEGLEVVKQSVKDGGRREEQKAKALRLAVQLQDAGAVKQLLGLGAEVPAETYDYAATLVVQGKDGQAAAREIVTLLYEGMVKEKGTRK
ncbi:MAG: ankyrin repeat domain-containing protein [Spirochaetia bacterium]|nr:ankyrin repeat domain-containing protein [Spirochaetia bacterium]